MKAYVCENVYKRVCVCMRQCVKQCIERERTIKFQRIGVSLKIWNVN